MGVTSDSSGAQGAQCPPNILPVWGWGRGQGPITKNQKAPGLFPQPNFNFSDQLLEAGGKAGKFQGLFHPAQAQEGEALAQHRFFQVRGEL